MLWRRWGFNDMSRGFEQMRTNWQRQRFFELRHNSAARISRIAMKRLVNQVSVRSLSRWRISTRGSTLEGLRRTREELEMEACPALLQSCPDTAQ